MAERISSPTWPARIEAGEAVLAGDLTVPDHATGLVIFAHGSGSGRDSPRNRAVALALERVPFATLLVDLLTSAEEQLDRVTAELRFDIPLLADRVTAAIDWAQAHASVSALPIGLFGASTGAAAALVAAAQRPRAVGAVVCRGGRPDLADAALEVVQAPTLLIVGGNDETVLALNREARARMTCPTELEVIPGASHLFEEPGALDDVASLAASWFERHLT